MASEGIKIISDNRKARHNYELFDRFEAGIALQGTEVKSIRVGGMNLAESYCLIDSSGEVILLEAHIAHYKFGNRTNHATSRPRKLLLHRREITRLVGHTKEKGLTLIPTKVYFKKGRVKVEIALAKGKKLHDKRETIKQRDALREAQRSIRESY